MNPKYTVPLFNHYCMQKRRNKNTRNVPCIFIPAGDSRHDELNTKRLYKFQERLNNPDFVQVSKHGLINIQHLEALEASFSGNMLAILTGKRKVDVSRRYLKNLEKRLGL